MKSTQDSFRVLSYNGKQYQFDYVAFNDLLAERAAESKKQIGVTGSRPEKATEAKTPSKGKGIPQSTWMNKIACELDVSFEAVKNWKQGYNGPKDIDSVVRCANILNTDALSLLKPLGMIQEYEKMNEKEKNVIEDVFRKCVDAIYCFSDRFQQYSDDKKANRLIEKNAETLFMNSIEEIHREVDKAALFVSDSVRYRLHRLLNDFYEMEWVTPIPDRWELIEENTKTNVDNFNLRFYYSFYKREDQSDNIWYFTDEQELAEKMNYSYTPIPDFYYDNVNMDGIPLDENEDPIPMEKFGITDTVNFEINPVILYRDMLTRVLRDVFLHDFPGLTNWF